MPTEAEINKAKDYLLLRLGAERSAVSFLDAALLSAARRIVEISRRYNIPPEKFRFSADPNLQAKVRMVLAILRDALYEKVKMLDTFEEEDEDETFIAPIITAKDNRKTFRQRLAEYVNHWGFEIEATIAAAGLAGVTDADKILQGIRDYLDSPYDNPWILDHMGEGDAVRLDAIPHFGRGKAIASLTALTILFKNVIAKGWMQNWARLNEGKRGYYVFRGSSYPCEICDAQVGFFHDISDVYGLPPQHPNCVCFTVYVD